MPKLGRAEAVRGVVAGSKSRTSGNACLLAVKKEKHARWFRRAYPTKHCKENPIIGNWP